MKIEISRVLCFDHHIESYALQLYITYLAVKETTDNKYNYPIEKPNQQIRTNRLCAPKCSKRHIKKSIANRSWPHILYNIKD